MFDQGIIGLHILRMQLDGENKLMLSLGDEILLCHFLIKSVSK